jgi:D-3-phosphoglycerate dehydrogenase
MTERIVLVSLGQSFENDEIRDVYYHVITDYLRERRFDVTVENGDEYDKELTVRLLKDVDGVIFSSNGPMSRDVMERLPRLRYIMRYGIGLDSVDLDAATDLGKIVCYTPGYCSDEIGVHAVALGLAALRNIPYYDKYTRRGIWLKGNGPIPVHPCNMTIGLFGLGASASVVARAMGQGFGARVIAHDPYVAQARAAELNVNLVPFDELLRQSDMLFIHAPLTEETFHVVSDDAFSKMMPNVILVNVSRGGLVDMRALRKALDEGKITKAALDVFEKEPPSPEDPIFQHEHVIATPHSAYYGRESLDRANFLVSRITARALEDKRLFRKNLANPAVLNRVPGYTLLDGPVE